MIASSLLILNVSVAHHLQRHFCSLHPAVDILKYPQILFRKLMTLQLKEPHFENSGIW